MPECMELCTEIGDKSIKSLFVMIRSQIYEHYIVVGICCRWLDLLDQEETVDETLGQLKEALLLPILVTHERLQHSYLLPEIMEQSRRLLEYVEDNFLIQLTDKWSRKCVLQ